MFKIIASLLLFCITTSSFAQKSSVKGLVVDSLTKSPLEFATVAIVNAKDTSLISYTLSDKKGAFNLSGIPSEKAVKLIISYVGYKTIRENLTLQKGGLKDLGTILFSSQHLNEVVIQGMRSPVVIKKDTIEFNTEAFKTRPNAVVEELLKKLPGVQINTDGSILVNGKAISKLLIDGKQFFGDDPKVATRNLDADMIDKIQMYDDRENDPDHKISSTKVNKIINLKLKSKIKKSTLGKVYAGGGTRDRYESGAILSSFRDTLQISLIGMANNLNKTGFSREELYSMGGFNRSDGRQAYNGTLGGRGWGGIEKVTAGGFNINNDYGNKLKLNLVYFYTNTQTASKGSSLSEQSLPDTKLTSFADYDYLQKSNKNAVSGLIEWNPDSTNRMRYEPKLNVNYDNSKGKSSGNKFNTQEPKLLENNGIERTDGQNNDFIHDFFYNHRFKKKGESINVSHRLALNQSSSDNFAFNSLTSYTSSLKSEIQDRYIDTRTKSNSANLNIDYNYPLTKKLFTETNIGGSYLSTNELLATFDKNNQSGAYDLFLQGQSNDLNRRQWVQNIKPVIGYVFTEEFNLRIGVNAEFQNVMNKFNGGIPNVSHHYFNLFPTFRFDGPGFSLDYNENIDQPSISAIQPITREFGQLYKVIGNPDLKPMHSRRIGANVYKYISAKQINLNGYLGLTFSDHTIIQKTVIGDNGVQTNTSVNKDGGREGYFGINFGKQLKQSANWKIGLNTNLNGNFGKNAFFLNADEGIQNRQAFSLGQGVNFNFKELFDLSTNYEFWSSNTSYKEVAYASVTTYSHSYAAVATLRWPKRIIFDVDYRYKYNPQISAGFQRSTNMLNMAVALQMFKKDRGQLKLSVYDLLDQNIQNFRFANANMVSSGSNEVLKRYVLLNYQYKFNIYKK